MITQPMVNSKSLEVPENSLLPRPAPEAEWRSKLMFLRRLAVSPFRRFPPALAMGAMVAVALAGLLTRTTLSRMNQEKEVNAAAAEVAADPPRVTVATVRRAPAVTERVLPGNSLPLMEAALYARTTGYLKSRRVDIGDRVKEGQLLAEISAPDVDDQLAQAKSNLEQAKANLVKAKADEKFATGEERRYRRLVASRAASEEEYESKIQGDGVAKAVVVAMEATIKVNDAAVQRFTDLQGFQKIMAPFPGVITARNVEQGDLISADSPSTTRELFHLMRTDTLRVFVNVPQVFATGIEVGQDAAVFLREQPQKQHPGKVARTASALDPSSRTLLTEVDVPNSDDSLRPGMYLQVRFAFDRKVFPVRIPAAAVVTRSDGPKVAVLDSQKTVRYRKVELGRDFGAEVEVTAGLQDGETVIVHPGDELRERTVVEPVALPTN